jgi:hypothetical protein
MIAHSAPDHAQFLAIAVERVEKFFQARIVEKALALNAGDGAHE